MISTAYENIVDAPYINRIRNEHLFMFNSVRYIISIAGEAIGIYYAGLGYNYGIGCILGLSAFFMIFQIGFIYKLIYMKNKENKLKKTND